MTHPTVVSSDGLAPKPRFGEPCNQCGRCCTIEPCALAVEYLSCRSGPCVALEFEGDKAFCGLVRHPVLHIFNATHPGQAAMRWDQGVEDETMVDARLGVAIAGMLRLGAGCDAPDE